jgi:hypothetical protein
MRTLTTCLRAAGCLAILSASCAPFEEEESLQRPGGGGDPESTESTLLPDDMAEGETDGEWRVTEPFPTAPDTNRVGILLALEGDAPPPPLEARLLLDGVPLADWVPFVVRWSEVDYHVLAADFGAAGNAVQLRVQADAVASIRFLRWTAVPPSPPADGEEESSGLGQTTSALRDDLLGLGIVTREMWGARDSTCTSNPLKYRVTIHHTETPSENAERQVRAIQNYHKDTKRWCDIGYHFLIGVDGTIYEGCPLAKRGTHVANQNTGNIGISFVGCFHPGCRWEPTRPPEAAIAAAGRLVGALSRIYGFPLNRVAVKAHRDQPGASTDCPGDYLYARIDDILAIGRGETSPSEPPAEDPAPTEPSPAACGGLACGSCEATAGCGWCAARGGCAADADSCAWTGAVGSAACWTELWPCAEASCWNPERTLTACGATSWDENFSSGRYSVHRYLVTLPAGGPLTIRLERTGGTFAPALLVSDRAGRMAYGGEPASLHPDVTVRSAASGRTGTFAEVTLEASRDVDAYLYVTGWAILDGAFRGTLATTSRYRVSVTQSCTPPAPPPGSATSALDAIWSGLSQGGSEIPRAGLHNDTMAFLGTTTEPYGDAVVDDAGRSWVRGRVSWFGGPGDTGVTSTETGAISGETLRALNNPVDPDAATLAARPADYYFAAMRWSYSPNGRSFWAAARLVVRNPATGAAVVVRPVDWGPNTSTRRTLDLSPQALRDLGLSTDGEADVAFAVAGSPLGPVR